MVISSEANCILVVWFSLQIVNIGLLIVGLDNFILVISWSSRIQISNKKLRITFRNKMCRNWIAKNKDERIN